MSNNVLKNLARCKPNAWKYNFNTANRPSASKLLNKYMSSKSAWEDTAHSSRPNVDDLLENAHQERNQEKFSYRPNVDPATTSIILFPGQGMQFPGMGQKLLEYPNVKGMFESASHILGYDLLDVCLKGPQEKLDRTIYSQPATVVCSLAAVERLHDEDPSAVESCVATAGFSVGEISALVFAGVITFEDAIRIVQVRSESMQLASDMCSSGMMTVMYGADSKLEYACMVAKEWCQTKLGMQDVHCSVANYLYPHCKVIAGNKEALEFIKEHASDFKLRRLKPLHVSGAFHTKLMSPAVEPIKAILKQINFNPPSIPVHANVDGKRYESGDISRKLIKQLVRPVCWEQTLHILYQRNQGLAFPKTFECGPGTSLKTILRMVNAKAWESCKSIDV